MLTLTHRSNFLRLLSGSFRGSGVRPQSDVSVPNVLTRPGSLAHIILLRPSSILPTAAVLAGAYLAFMCNVQIYSFAKSIPSRIAKGVTR